VIILDTNVISELLRPVPARQVEAWLSEQDGALTYFTTVGEAELRNEVSILPAGKRRSALTKAIDSILDEDLRDRILPFDREAARTYAIVAAGRPISQFDCQIAAIARAHGAAVATRNSNDFTGCGIDVLDPWVTGTEFRI
jgi:toxin FitB